MLFGIASCRNSNLQAIMTLSTTQAKYIELTQGENEAMWWMIGKLGIVQDNITIYCDSQSTTHLANHPIYLERTKHRHHNTFSERHY